jgi:hypothetical protein
MKVSDWIHAHAALTPVKKPRNIFDRRSVSPSINLEAVEKRKKLLLFP